MASAPQANHRCCRPTARQASPTTGPARAGRRARATRSSSTVNGAASNVPSSASRACSVAGQDGAEVRGGKRCHSCVMSGPITAAAAAVGPRSAGASPMTGALIRSVRRTAHPASHADTTSPGQSPTPPNGRDRGEPVTERSVRRVRRAAWGNGPVATPKPRPRPTQQRPVGAQRGSGPPEHRPRRVIGQCPACRMDGLASAVSWKRGEMLRTRAPGDQLVGGGASGGGADTAVGRRRGRVHRAVNDLAGLLEATRIAVQTRQRLSGTTPQGAHPAGQPARSRRPSERGGR